MQKIPIQKIDSYIWKIPQNYRHDMKVPVTIFASEELLEKMQLDRTLVQGVNVATLPGVLKHSVVLPDAHEGYGFPIGGVGATDYNEGVISPGGVGYDINCLPPGSKVLHYLGYTKPIEKIMLNDLVTVIDSGLADNSRVLLTLKRRSTVLVEVKTRSGHRLSATLDHPILTDNGMKQASEIRPGTRVALFPFEGIEYKEPSEFTILNEDNIVLSKNIINELKKRGLFPLNSKNLKLPFLIKLLGYFTGDGTFNGKKTVFYGSREGLKEIRRDVKLLGYSPSRIHTRIKKVKLKNKIVESTENYIYVSSKSFTSLLKALGAPISKKTTSDFEVPQWLMKLPLWMKRLYVAALFGAELNKPQTVNGYNFEPPLLTISKKIGYAESGRRFLLEIASILKEAGIETTGINYVFENNSVRLRLQISSKPENLIKLYEKIGYEYNPERRRLGLAAATWLRIKERVINRRKSATRLAVALAQNGVSRTEIINSLASENVNSRFIERALYESRRSDPRIPTNFQRFEEWFVENCQNDIIWDFVEEVHLVEYDGEVYDITVNHQAHNFISEGFVVSNCGVRLMVTNLDEKDVRPRITDIINVLFTNIPSGLGSRRKDFSITISDLDRIAVEGARYIVEKFGLGWHEDIMHCEEEGAMEGADPKLVSPTAKSRGIGQIGTLGSGNHFLEVQRVDKIFDPKAAEKMGITHEGQITVLIHTGSRGFGHQICGDYLRVMERASAKYGIKLPDRELACAPASSPEADQYLKAFKCAVNFAFANRQAITHWVRQSFEQVFKKSADALGMRLIYDVAHNIVKLEEHTVDKKMVKVWVHRKGATRSFPASHPLIPKTYRDIGQPVLIPGSMGTASWILLGNTKAMELTFGSTAHGAGREMSRAAAKRTRRATDIVNELKGRGIYIKADSMETIVEEADDAYKSVDKVVEVSHGVGIATKVARLVPIGVIKG